MFLKLLLPLALVIVVTGFQTFQSRIPNGDKVPNPCDSSTIWPGVGHLNPAGGGPRNPFGLDFYAANKTWTRDLCQKDSDGDGKTNGQELGDPNCNWTPEHNVVSDPTGQPGICEPLDSDACSGSTFVCPGAPVGK